MRIKEDAELKSQLCDILPKIKVDGEDEQALMKVIREYDESPFSKANTLEWMKILEDEVIYVDNLIKLAKDRQVPMATAKGKFEGEKLKAMQGMFYFEAKFLSCLNYVFDRASSLIHLFHKSLLFLLSDLIAH